MQTRGHWLVRERLQSGGSAFRLSSGVHLEVGERGGKEPSRETKRKRPERWEGGRESRRKGALLKWVWPVVVKVAAKSGLSLGWGRRGSGPSGGVWGGEGGGCGLALCPGPGVLGPWCAARRLRSPLPLQELLRGSPWTLDGELGKPQGGAVFDRGSAG